MKAATSAKRGGKFDAHGRKIRSPNSPVFYGTRVAGPPGRRPRWQASLLPAMAEAERAWMPYAAPSL